MANTLRFKRGLASGLPTGLAGEPLFTTDTFDLYIGTGAANQRYQKYIASGTTLQYLRGDGSLATFPTNIITGTGVAGQVAYWSATSTQAGNSDFLWDNTNKTLTVQNTNATSFSNIALSANGGVNTRGLNLYAFGSTYTGVGAFSPSYVAISTGISVARLAFVSFGSFAWYVGGSTAASEAMQLTANGRLLLGSTSEGTQRLQVTGDTLLKGSGNTSATSALLVQNSAGTQLLKIQNDGTGNVPYILYVGQNTTNPLLFSFDGNSSSSANAAGRNLSYFNTNTTQTGDQSHLALVGNALTPTSGDTRGLLIERSFAPTSGTAIFTAGRISPTINQTGGANGITRGLLINPTLTAAADWRSIEWSNNTGWGLYGAGTAANFFNGSLGIGTTTLTGFSLRINKAITGSIESYGISQQGAVSNDVTTVAVGIDNALVLNAGAVCSAYNHFRARRQVYAATSFGTQIGFLANNTLTDATNNYGFYGDIASGTGRWNLYMNGTARNYLAGELLVNTLTSVAGYQVAVGGSIYTSTNIRFDAAIRDNRDNAIISQSLLSVLSNRVLTIGNGTYLNINFPNGNMLIGSTTDSGEKLQVNGTMKVTGASTFNTSTLIQSGGNGLSSSPIAIGFNRNVLIGGLYNTSAHAYQWTKTNSTTATLDYLDLQVYTPAEVFVGNAIRINGTGAATFSSSVQAASLNVTGASTFSAALTLNGGNIDGVLGDAIYFGNAGFPNAQKNRIRSSISASVNNFLVFETSTATLGTYNLNQFVLKGDGNVGVGTTTPTTKLDVNGTFNATGAATFSSSVTATAMTLTATGGQLKLKDSANEGFVGVSGTSMYFTDFATAAKGLIVNISTGAATFSDSIQAATAIAIGTTPDTNKPFKILKNINATVGINFENTSTSANAFSAIQMGTDVTGGTKFTNLVYASSGVVASGVYNPDGTSLINNGGGGLNFLGTPTRFYTGGSNGVLRLLFDNEGTTQFTATTPTTNATDGYKQYSADVVAGNAAPHFRTENGAVIKLYQETTGVGNAIFSAGGGTGVLDDSTFDGYTLRQIVKALRNQGILA